MEEMRRYHLEEERKKDAIWRESKKKEVEIEERKKQIEINEAMMFRDMRKDDYLSEIEGKKSRYYNNKKQ